MGDTVLRLCLLSALLGGCGKVSDHTPGPADAGIDADLSGNATIVTQMALFGGKIGDKAGNIDIISNLPNNMVLATTMTDANGNATIKVYPGGTVTAVYNHTVDMGADLITWVGVKPGDTLTFGNRSPSLPPQSKDLGAVNYSWPPLANATQYDVFSTCASNGVVAPTTTLTVEEFDTCHQDSIDVLYFAFNNGALIGYSFRSNVTFTPGVTIAALGWTTSLATGTITITGLPPDFTTVSGSFRSIINSNRQFNVAGSYSGTLTGGAFSGMFSSHPTAERTVGQVFLSHPGFSGIEILDSFPSNTLVQTVSAPTLPPGIQSNTIASSALRTASWFLVPDASSTYDGQTLHANWNHVVSGTSRPHQWDFILPPGQTSIEFPALPAQFNEHLPFPQEGLGASIRVFDISSVTSYDMLRTLPSANVMCLLCSVNAGDFQRVIMSP